MADNVLGVLFQDIADAIRSKTGGTDTMVPNDFPDEILSIVVGGGTGSGDGAVTVDNLRIAEGIFHTANTGAARQTITHDLGVIPDMVMYYGLFLDVERTKSATIGEMSWHSNMMSRIEGTSKTSTFLLGNIICARKDEIKYCLNNPYAETYGSIYCPDYQTIRLGGSSLCENTEYHWIAISGMGGAVIEGGGGSVEGYATVTFMNGGEELFSRLVMVGDDCPDPYVQGRIELPTKESTAQYDYTFNGWAATDGGSADSNALKGITEDKVLYAAYKSVVRSYTVTYYDEDGTLLHTEQLAYGSMPSYVPTKEGVVFNGWTPKTPVTGDTSYTATWATAVAGGSCGDSAMWSLSTDYVLTISGTGATNSAPWKDNYTEQIVEVVIGEGITSIYTSSFSSHTNVKSVTIPSTLTGFGSYAFNGCTAIESVYITDLAAWLEISNVSNGPSASATPTYYLNGEPITGELVVPDTVTSIARYACKGWNITGVVFHNGVTSIDGYAFNGCTALTEVTVPSNITSVGDSAFEGCTSLQRVVFNAPCILPNRCFRGCTNLESMVLGDGVIGFEPFFILNTKVTSINIPASVNSIGMNSFYNSIITSAVFDDTEGWTAGDTALASADLANPATAATYLKSTYVGKVWTKS